MFEDDSLKFRMFMHVGSVLLQAIETDLADVMTPGFNNRAASVNTTVFLHGDLPILRVPVTLLGGRAFAST